MNTTSQRQTLNLPSAEQRLTALGTPLPAPTEPFGAYVEAVRTGNLLFLSGMLPREGPSAKFIGRVGAEIDVDAERKAAHLAAGISGDRMLNGRALDKRARQVLVRETLDDSRGLSNRAEPWT